MGEFGVDDGWEIGCMCCLAKHHRLLRVTSRYPETYVSLNA